MPVDLSNTLFLALAFLTKKGYVHRDVSPVNIIIYKGRAKLNNLEFAKQYEGVQVCEGVQVTSNRIRIVSQPPLTLNIWYLL